MGTLHPDHSILLAFAKVAIDARDDQQAWRDDFTKACDFHAAACNDLWDELERQVQAAAGQIPVIEHPTRIAARRARQMRQDIVTVASNAVVEALEEYANWEFVEAD